MLALLYPDEKYLPRIIPESIQYAGGEYRHIEYLRYAFLGGLVFPPSNF